MIDYDDPKWDELKGGYGIPYNPTSALKKLELDENIDSSFDELWENLHHQGDVGEASYAVVPHLVRIHRDIRNLGWQMYSLISTIEIERHRKTNPSIPNWLEQSYAQAWQDVFPLATKDYQAEQQLEYKREILAAIMLSGKDIRLGALVNFLDEAILDELNNNYLNWDEEYR